MCTGQCAVRDVDRIAHRGSDDFGMDIRVIAEHLCNGLNQVDAGLADIVQTPQKGADIGSTGTGSQQRLICAEDQGAVGGNALAAQHLDGIDCMKLTLADAGIAPEQVDHINAHGTGTHMNDACETAAIHAVFGEHAKQLTVVSTKSMTGHLLGGAGGIEAVFTALALRDQFAPPTIHYEQPDPECDLDYVPNAGRAQTMTYALSNSLGFGGHNACIALRRWEG